MNTIELFCGTKSFSKVADELGHETWTTDWDEVFKPTLVGDILELKSTDIPQPVDVLWASPPCESFSIASVYHHWHRDENAVLTPKSLNAITGLKMLHHTVQLLASLQPTLFYIENPRGMMRKILPAILNAQGCSHLQHTITYCQYGDTRMKPTDIWTNDPLWSPRPVCRNGDPCHERAPRGSRTGTQGRANYMERSRIPPQLFTEIFSAHK